MKHTVTFVPFVGRLNFHWLHSDRSLSFHSVKGA